MHKIFNTTKLYIIIFWRFFDTVTKKNPAGRGSTRDIDIYAGCRDLVFFLGAARSISLRFCTHVRHKFASARDFACLARYWYIACAVQRPPNLADNSHDLNMPADASISNTHRQTLLLTPSVGSVCLL